MKLVSLLNAPDNRMKKKILILCDYFLPGFKAGGPVRSLASLVEHLKEAFDLTVVTRDHDLVTKAPYANIHSDQVNKKFGCDILYLSEKNLTKTLCHFLKNQRYDVIYLNSFFSPKFSLLPLLLIKFNRLKARSIILSPRGELSSGALSIKRIRKNIFIHLYRYIFPFKRMVWHATSNDEANALKKIWGDKIIVCTLANLSSIKKIKSIRNDKKANEIRIIFISRISKKKNLLFALDVLSQTTGRIFFDIYGPIHDEKYWQTCLERIKTLPDSLTIHYRGNLSHKKVTNTLQQYDLFFLPTRNENYGHVIVEALASACPVLLSDQTPWQDLSTHHAGWTYSFSDVQKFCQRIDALTQLNNDAFLKFKQGAWRYFSEHIEQSGLAQQYQSFMENPTQ